MARGWLLALGLAIAAAPAIPAAAQNIDCEHTSVQPELNACAYREYQKADATLNHLYAQLRARLGDPGQQALLAEAERAWIAYRDRQCDFETAPEAGGSIHPMVQSMCLQKETEARSATLQRLLKCAEGDLSCPR